MLGLHLRFYCCVLLQQLIITFDRTHSIIKLL